MKLLLISPNRKQIKIGDEIKTASWYYTTDSISIEGLEVGDEVSFAYDLRGTRQCLTFLAKGTVEVPQEHKQQPKVAKSQNVAQKTYNKTSTTNDKTSRQDWIDKDMRIQRQSIGKMTAEAIKPLEGILTTENIVQIIGEVYDAFKQKVEE